MKKILISFFILIYLGCAPKKIIKTSDLALKDKIIPVSEEEFQYYKEKVKTGKNSYERAEGAFWTGQFYYNKNEQKEALKYFEYNEKYYKDIIWGFLSLLRMVDIYIDDKNFQKTLEKIIALVEIRHAFSQYEQEIFNRLENFLTKQEEKEVLLVYEKHFHKLIDEYALYVLCNINYEKKNYDEFLKYANIFLSGFFDSKFFDEINKKFKETIKFKTVNNKKIGVVIPLSGKEKELGDMIKRGIELAIDEYNQDKIQEDKISLIYIDEMEEENKFLQKFIKVIEEESVIAFLGPLYSSTAKKLFPIIDRYAITLFSPTASQPDLSGKSQYFFRNCGTARGQAYAIAKYIKEKAGIKNIGILYPDNAFGKSIKNFFVEKYIKEGGNVVKEVYFNPDKNDFKDELILLGGVNTNLLKEQRAKEKINLSENMKEISNKILNAIEVYFNLPKRETEKVKIEQAKKNLIKKIKIALLHFSPIGNNIVKYEIDSDATKQLSFALAKDYRMDVLKQKITDDEMARFGVEYEDLDREIALNIAHNVGADILIWGQIIEQETNTIYANFMPELIIDEKGNSKIAYNFSEKDYFGYIIKIYVISVADEAIVFETKMDYSKIKEPSNNPLKLEALYIPASDKKIVLIKDQLKFYDLDLPVFGASTLAGNYILNFLESVAGIIFPQEFYPESNEEKLQEFIAKYKEKYATFPTVISVNSYNMMKMCEGAINSNIKSREDFKNYLKNLKTYDGLTGLFYFGFDGEPIIDYYLMKIETDGIKFLEKIRGE